ncbi:MAG TPA: septum site-determining protein MinC, partial [Alicycliphilus sp.]|nr:septum site-determining protein MinC [Alicycliphilus sp.]
MAVDTAGQARTHLDLKSAQLSVVAMVLKTVGVSALAADLATRSADDPEFFDNDPVLIDLSAVQGEEQPIDFAALLQTLRSHRTQPV